MPDASPEPASAASLNVLYRMFDRDGNLLYVGITLSPTDRFRAHEESKSWWSTVATISLEHFESRDALAAAEKAAVRTEKPLWNTVRFIGGTLRSFRISDQLYGAAQSKAAAGGESLSDVVRRELERYVANDE